MVKNIDKEIFIITSISVRPFLNLGQYVIISCLNTIAFGEILGNYISNVLYK